MNINLKWSRKGIDCMAEKIREDGECAELPALLCLDMIVMLQNKVAELTDTLAAVMADEWRDVGTIPKIDSDTCRSNDLLGCWSNGRMMVVSYNALEPNYPWQDAEDHLPLSARRENINGYYPAYLTHWMPLPEKAGEVYMKCPKCPAEVKIDCTPEINSDYPFEVCCYECGWFDSQRYADREAAELSMRYRKAEV